MRCTQSPCGSQALYILVYGCADEHITDTRYCRSHLIGWFVGTHKCWWCEKPIQEWLTEPVTPARDRLPRSWRCSWINQ